MDVVELCAIAAYVIHILPGNMLPGHIRSGQLSPSSHERESEGKCGRATDVEMLAVATGNRTGLSSSGGKKSQGQE